MDERQDENTVNQENERIPLSISEPDEILQFSSIDTVNIDSSCEFKAFGCKFLLCCDGNSIVAISEKNQHEVNLDESESEDYIEAEYSDPTGISAGLMKKRLNLRSLTENVEITGIFSTDLRCSNLCESTETEDSNNTKGLFFFYRKSYSNASLDKESSYSYRLKVCWPIPWQEAQFNTLQKVFDQMDIDSFEVELNFQPVTMFPLALIPTSSLALKSGYEKSTKNLRFDSPSSQVTQSSSKTDSHSTISIDANDYRKLLFLVVLGADSCLHIMKLNLSIPTDSESILSKTSTERESSSIEREVDLRKIVTDSKYQVSSKTRIARKSILSDSHILINSPTFYKRHSECFLQVSPAQGKVVEDKCLYSTALPVLKTLVDAQKENGKVMFMKNCHLARHLAVVLALETQSLVVILYDELSNEIETKCLRLDELPTALQIVPHADEDDFTLLVGLITGEVLQLSNLIRDIFVGQAEYPKNRLQLKFKVRDYRDFSLCLRKFKLKNGSGVHQDLVVAATAFGKLYIISDEVNWKIVYIKTFTSSVLLCGIFASLGFLIIGTRKSIWNINLFEISNFGA